MQTVLDQFIYTMTSSPALWVGLVCLFGLMVGSFLNVVIHRLPIMLNRDWRAQAQELLSEQPAADGKPDGIRLSNPQPAAEPYNLVEPRSACPKCRAPITALQNIPVISYLVLKGRCANCGNPISVRYPIVELVTAILSAVVAWRFGVHWYTGAALLLTWFLIALSAIDFDTGFLPDDMTMPLIWMGLLLSLAGTDAALGLPVDMRSSILGAVCGYLSLWCVYHVYRLITGQEGMGFGDFKLFAALGAWLGWKMLPLIILLSACTGAVVGIVLIAVYGRDRKIPIPFGPYLAAAGWIALLWGEQIVGTYMRVSGLDRS
ncbi:MAG TPA: A24 family peptidase [Povalibacter sp.]|nr:A24 family peptidase [Povalibacter sp.]